MSARKPKQPEPLRLGDDKIAREEVAAYYTRQIEQARAELAEAQERFNRDKARAEAAIDAFEAGERLPRIDAWQLEVNAGNLGELARTAFTGGNADVAAYGAAKARNEATNRWLRHYGYESVEEAR